MKIKTWSSLLSSSPVMFVTHKRFSILFFLPSCCVNSPCIITTLQLSKQLPWQHRIQTWQQRIQTSESLGSVFPLFCQTKLIFRIIVTGEIVWREISSILSFSPTILFMVMKHFIKMELLQMYMTSVQELISWVKKS